MTATLGLRVSVCRECGDEFEDRSRTSPRSYCYVCRPLKSTAVGADSVSPIAGVPFTIEHFERWAFELTLDTGEAWRVERYFADWLEDLFAGAAENWLLVGEGNAKTTGIAGLTLYHCEHTPFAWVPWAASSRDQAEIGYIQAEGFVQRSARLDAVFKCHPGYRRIRHKGGGRIQIFAADDRTGDGVIPTLAVLDELHRHKNLRLYRTWRGKLPKRGGQLVTISTAGEPGSEFEQTRERIRTLADDVRVDGCFTRAVGQGGKIVLHDWSVPANGDPSDLELVKSANPFSGVTLEVLEEKRDSPTMTEEHWRRFVCNLPTRDAHSAVAESDWFARESDERIPVQTPVWVGLDVGLQWDTTAIVPLWWREEDFRLLGPATVLVPPRDGSMLDISKIKRELEQLHTANPIIGVVMDMTNAADIAQWLENDLKVEVFQRPQSVPAKAEEYAAFMEALRSGCLWHTGDAGLTAHVMNAVVNILPRGDARFARISKTRHGDNDRRVIDALDAAAMVHVVAQASGRRTSYRTAGFA